LSHRRPCRFLLLGRATTNPGQHRWADPLGLLQQASDAGAPSSAGAAASAAIGGSGAAPSGTAGRACGKGGSCTDRCLQTNYGSLADYAYNLSYFGVLTPEFWKVASVSVGAKVVLGAGVVGGASYAASTYATKGAGILSTPLFRYGPFGIFVRGAEANAAFAASARYASVARFGLQGGKLLGVAGTVAGVGATSFYGTAYTYCYVACRGQQ
jgi:hypothetical protein